MAQLRHIVIRKLDSGLVLDGTEGWTNPSTPEMVLHDIFHHAPDDDGSMACEVMSFGAQCWIEHHADGIRLGIGHEGLSAVLEDLARDPAKRTDRHRFVIESPAPEHEPADPLFMERFMALVQAAVIDSSDSHAFVDMSDDLVSEITSDANVQCYAQWMSYGLRRAQKRFPDPVATRELFNRLLRVIRAWSKDGEQPLSFLLDEQRCAVACDDLEGALLLKAARVALESARPAALRHCSP